MSSKTQPMSSSDPCKDCMKDKEFRSEVEQYPGYFCHDCPKLFKFRDKALAQLHSEWKKKAEEIPESREAYLRLCEYAIEVDKRHG